MLLLVCSIMLARCFSQLATCTSRSVCCANVMFLSRSINILRSTRTEGWRTVGVWVTDWFSQNWSFSNCPVTNEYFLIHYHLRLKGSLNTVDDIFFFIKTNLRKLISNCTVVTFVNWFDNEDFFNRQSQNINKHMVFLSLLQYEPKRFHLAIDYPSRKDLTYRSLLSALLLF